MSLQADRLGESIGWVDGNNELWRVDILRGLVHRVAEPLSARPTIHRNRFEGEVGFALPRSEGGMVVGAERTIWLVDSEGRRSRLLELDERPENRWNDAACDSQGRLWAGTFARDRQAGTASLYRIEPDGAIEQVLGDLTISNGFDWLDGETQLHFVDSPTQRIDVFDVDVERGRLSGRRTLASIPPEHGAPDGLVVDDIGQTWVALFGGGRLQCFGDDGQLLGEHPVPVPHVTNLCFGGDDGRDLFVSTTQHKLSAAAKKAWPLAGRVFSARSEVAGHALQAFAG